jgi:hypothetical protein
VLDGSLAPPAPVALVVPPVWAQVFYPTALLLGHALEDLGVQAEVVEYSGRFPHRLNVLLGWSLYPEPLPADCRYIIYQLEPLCLPHWQERLAERRLLFERATAIWDYSRINLPFLQPFAASWVPLGFHPKMKPVSQPVSEAASELLEPREIDALFVGSLSPRRRALLEALSQRCGVSLEPRWGPELRRTLQRSKIVLNIHQFDMPMPIEQPRVAQALNQGAFVLTEDSIENPYSLVSVPYEGLLEATMYFLHHPDERKQRQAAMVAEFARTSMAGALRAPIASLGLIEATTEATAEATAILRPDGDLQPGWR